MYLFGSSLWRLWDWLAHISSNTFAAITSLLSYSVKVKVFQGVESRIQDCPGFPYLGHQCDEKQLLLQERTYESRMCHAIHHPSSLPKQEKQVPTVLNTSLTPRKKSLLSYIIIIVTIWLPFMLALVN